MNDNRYTIEPINLSLGCLKAGDLIDMVTDDTITGPYCAWPKQEPRRFVVTDNSLNSPEFIEKVNREYTDELLLKELNKDLKKEPEKFYQKLNRKKW